MWLPGSPAVQGGAQPAGRVDGVVASQVVAGQDVTDDLTRGPVGGFRLRVAGGRNPLCGGVAARVSKRPVAVGVGEGDKYRPNRVKRQKN